MDFPKNSDYAHVLKLPANTLHRDLVSSCWSIISAVIGTPTQRHEAAVRPYEPVELVLHCCCWWWRHFLGKLASVTRVKVEQCLVPVISRIVLGVPATFAFRFPENINKLRTMSIRLVSLCTFSIVLSVAQVRFFNGFQKVRD